MHQAKSSCTTFDTVIRAITAVLIGILVLAGKINGTAAIILGILAVVFLLTGIAAVCPLYAPFGIFDDEEGVAVLFE
jgi:glucose uptake protein GlcU